MDTYIRKFSQCTVADLEVITGLFAEPPSLLCEICSKLKSNEVLTPCAQFAIHVLFLVQCRNKK